MTDKKKDESVVVKNIKKPNKVARPGVSAVTIDDKHTLLMPGCVGNTTREFADQLVAKGLCEIIQES